EPADRRRPATGRRLRSGVRPGAGGGPEPTGPEAVALMSADDLLQFATQALFVAIFLAALVQAVRRPWRANVDAPLLFGAVARLVAEQWLTTLVGIVPGGLLRAFNASLLMALPYLLLRLVDDFADVPRPVMWTAEGG